MDDESHASRDAKPANKRGAARLAAVQALFQMDVSGTGVMEVAAEYETHRLGQMIDGVQYLDADPAWFRGILAGVVKDQTKLDPIIRDALQEDWPLSRIDSTLRAILRAAVFELMERKDIPVAVVISEYLDVSRAFYDDGDESKMVNAVLDRIARRVRDN